VERLDTCLNGRLTENVFKRISANSNPNFNPKPTVTLTLTLKLKNLFGKTKLCHGVIFRASVQIRERYTSCFYTLVIFKGVILTTCQQLTARSEDEFELLCDEDGLFNTTQCSNEQCWCVNKNSGETLPGTTRPTNFFDLDCRFLGGNFHFYYA